MPYTPTGPEMERFARLLAEHARASISPTRPSIIRPAQRSRRPTPIACSSSPRPIGLIIVEDGIFADFEREAIQRLAALDGLHRVIQIGSFSKTLSASMRCGYIAARAEWIDSLIDMKLATSFGSDPFSAELVFAVLSDGVYRKHVEALNRRLAEAMGETLDRLKGLGFTPWYEPKGGMFLWMKLPAGIDLADVARRALAENVVLAPGNVFSASQSANNYMRFNVAQTRGARLFTVLEKA